MPGKTPIEKSYDLTNAGVMPEKEERRLSRQREQATAEAAGLFTTHGFEPERTRAVARVVRRGSTA